MARGDHYIRGGELLEDPPVPQGFTLVRCGPGRPVDIQAAETAMVAGGEEPGLSAPRYAHGDEFFGWATADGAHVGSAVRELREQMANSCVDNILEALAGRRPLHGKNPEIYATAA